jgi:hypothetical protein
MIISINVKYKGPTQRLHLVIAAKAMAMVSETLKAKIILKMSKLRIYRLVVNLEKQEFR